MSLKHPLSKEPAPGRQFATLGGGCFWCLEAVFEELQGVADVESGYAGGHVANPTYRQVCEGGTGHAEVVRIEFDPQAIGYREILEVFFAIHDPTTLNRQGSDAGEQYRSVIFHHSDEQQPGAGLLHDGGVAEGREVPPHLCRQAQARWALNPRRRPAVPPQVRRDLRVGGYRSAARCESVLSRSSG